MLFKPVPLSACSRLGCQMRTPGEFILTTPYVFRFSVAERWLGGNCLYCRLPVTLLLSLLPRWKTRLSPSSEAEKAEKWKGKSWKDGNSQRKGLWERVSTPFFRFLPLLSYSSFIPFSCCFFSPSRSLSQDLSHPLGWYHSGSRAKTD